MVFRKIQVNKLITHARLGGRMKKSLILFAFIALCVAIAILPAVQSQGNRNGNDKGKFRRSERRIQDQYIVVLDDNVADVDLEASRLAQNYFGDRSNGY